MSKNINLALITIGNGDWKNTIKKLWSSLDIIEEGFMLDRCYDEYFYKLEIDDIQLPSELTNNPMHLTNDYILRLFISMPIESNHKDNNKMVLLPWYEEEMEYKLASKSCSEWIVMDDKFQFNNVIILCGDNLDKEEMHFRHYIANLCADNNKTFFEIGNNCGSGCINIDCFIKWIESGENYCAYHPDNVKVTVK